MKKYILAVLVALCFVLLTGCAELSGLTGSATPEGEEVVSEIPVGAILPVFEDEEKGIKSSEIVLTDFTLTLPEGYAYGKKDYTAENSAGKTNTYTTYYVWMDAEDREYVFDTDTHIMLYIYDGIDTDSPHPKLDKLQAKTALRTVYLNYFFNLVGLRNGLYETDAALNSNEEYWTFCFTGNSGEYITTSYGDACYPNAYSGFLLTEAETDDSDRGFYAFVFSNEETGEIFTESEYNDLMKQIKKQFKITDFHGSLEFKIDVTDGYTYDELVTDVLYTNDEGKVLKRGIFYNTLMYYVTETGRSYERTNVDGKKETTDTESEEQIGENTEESTVPHVHTNDCCMLICGLPQDENHTHSKECVGFGCDYAVDADEDNGESRGTE